MTTKVRLQQVTENDQMDKRLVNLNKVLSQKISSFSKNRRPIIREDKEIARFILDNWDNLKSLRNVAYEDVSNKGLLDILISRIEELTPKAPKNEEKPKAAKTVRKVGDIHKNGIWVWTEYRPGKFDWRTIKKDAK